MTFKLRERGIRVVVLDIEGTTTPIAFVYGVLFPFVRLHLRPYLRDLLGADGLCDPIRRLRKEWAEDTARGDMPPDWDGVGSEQTTSSVAAYVEWLMDRDRKSPGLKLLQGQIWERGYRAGILEGEVFSDVPRALERWHQAGIAIVIYSSGSKLAQRLLLESTREGDLTRFISGFFDTAVGAKIAPDSYRRIAGAVKCPLEHMLFVSDATAEVDAARSAGCQTLLCARPGNPAQPLADAAQVIKDLDEIAV